MKKNELEKYREEINKVDAEIVKNLKKRFEVTKKVGKYKLRKGLKVLNKKRERKILEKVGKIKGLNSEFTKKIFKIIFKESRRLQRRLK